MTNGSLAKSCIGKQPVISREEKQVVRKHMRLRVLEKGLRGIGRKTIIVILKDVQKTIIPGSNKGAGSFARII